MVGPDVPSEKVRVMLEDGLLAAEQAVREAAEAPRQYDPVFGHNWTGRHDFYTGETRDEPVWSMAMNWCEQLG